MGLPFCHLLLCGEGLTQTLVMQERASFGEGGYAEACARSENGIEGPWIQDEAPLFGENGGHGMIFSDFNGNLFLVLHTPNEHLKERPVFYPLREENGNLCVCP